MAPGSTDAGMPVCAVAIAPSPIVRWPATPTWPARVTRLPTRVLPAIPTWPASTVSWPITTEWPTCTRLSILVPRPMRVSLMEARSMAARAPISTSSSTTTIPTCGIFS